MEQNPDDQKKPLQKTGLWQAELCKWTKQQIFSKALGPEIGFAFSNYWSLMLH